MEPNTLSAFPSSVFRGAAWRSGLKVGLVYGLVSLAWIWGSDELLARLPLEEETRRWIATIKGTGFVLATTVMLVVIVRREVGAQTEMARRLRDAEQRFGKMLAAPDRVHWILDLAADRFEFVSQGARTLRGKSPEELMERASRWNDGLDAGDAARLAEARRACRDGESQGYQMEYRLRRPDGGVIWIDESASILGPGPDARRLNGLCRDVTERRLAAERLKEQEAELVRSELRHRVLFERNLLPMWICDAQSWRMVLVNDAALKAYGYSREEFLGMTLPFLEPEEDREPGRDDPSVHGPRRLVRHVRKNRSIIMVDLFCQPVSLEGREMRLVVAHDVTARVQAERDLRRSRERLELVMAGADLGTWEWDMVTDEVVMSERLLLLLGHGIGERLGNLAAWRERSHPDDLKRLVQRVQGHLAGRSPVLECELRIRSGTGQWVWINLRGAVVERGPDGSPLRMMGTYLDINARKEAEASFQAIAHRLRLATHAAGIGVWEWDVPTSRVSWDSQMRSLHGLAEDAGPADLNGWLGLIATEDRTGVWLAMSRLLEEGADYRIEYRVRLPDGGTRHINSFGTIDRDVAGNPLRVVGVNYDVTSRKLAEIEIRSLNQDLERRVAVRTAELEATNRELEAFSYSVSHDLRAPLRAVDGFSLALAEDAGPVLDPISRSHLDRIRAAARRMGQLIDDLLHLSRVTRVALKRVPVDVSALAWEVAQALSAQAEGRQAQVSITAGMRAHADEGLLRIVLENLIGNAFKFTSKRDCPVIEIGAEAGESGTVFHVRDNGAGFDMGYAGKLFGAFQRLHGRDEFPGTGIGLATCQRIVHRHGGRIWVDAAVEKGATFFFTLDPDASFRADSPDFQTTPRSTS